MQLDKKNTITLLFWNWCLIIGELPNERVIWLIYHLLKGFWLHNYREFLSLSLLYKWIKFDSSIALSILYWYINTMDSILFYIGYRSTYRLLWFEMIHFHLELITKYRIILLFPQMMMSPVYKCVGYQLKTTSMWCIPHGKILIRI